MSQEESDGTDRQAQEGDPDPSTVTIGAQDLTVGGTGTITHVALYSGPGPGAIPLGTWQLGVMATTSGSDIPIIGGRLSFSTSQVSMVYGYAGEHYGPIPEETDDMPILAHRAARLRIARKGPVLTPLNSMDALKLDADFECRCSPGFGTTQELPHAEPTPHSTCGFYAVPGDVEAWHQEATVDLLVELSGTVIVHELGYRASHQRILSVNVMTCPFCDAPPTHVSFDSQYFVSKWGCSRHLPGKRRNRISTDELATQLGVPIIVRRDQ